MSRPSAPDSSSADPLVALWRTAPKPDTQQLLEAIANQRRLHRRLNTTLGMILASVTVLLVFEEATGRLATHGWLSGAWCGCLAASLAWRYRARCRRSDAASKTTLDLLRSMARQARTDLFLARCLWAGVPAGAVFGSLLTQWLALRSGPVQLPAAGPALTVSAIAVLAGMVLAGLVLARSRKAQMRELDEKLKSLASEP